MTKKKLQEENLDRYFMDIAHTIGKRANCLTRQVGAILVVDERIISTGNNGTPMGFTPCCNKGGCLRCKKRISGALKSGEENDKCFCIHAEIDVFMQAAYHGTSTKGASLYSEYLPCNQCAKYILQAGIRRVIYRGIYDDETGIQALKKAHIDVVHLT